jgi:hypothetical protein
MRGGKRRRHVPPLLTPQQIAGARLLRSLGVPYKQLVPVYHCSRETLSRAVNASRTYRGYL